MSDWGSTGRANSIRSNLSRLRASFVKSPDQRLTLTALAKVERCADEARFRAYNHFEKHKHLWMGTRFQELFDELGEKRAFTALNKADNPMARLGARAKAEIYGHQAARLGRIDRAEQNMKATGRVRANRTIGRGIGLGE